MYSDSDEYYSDSLTEETDEQSSNIQSIYETITDSLSQILKEQPLYNKRPLPIAIFSRIDVLSELYDTISDRYENDIDLSWVRFRLNDLKETIYRFAKLVDDMENRYYKLECSLDTPVRGYVRLFPISLDTYLNDTRRNIIKKFNEFIADERLIFKSANDVEMELPLWDELKIPDNLI